MGSNEIEYLPKEVLEEGFDSQQEKDIREMDGDELVTVDSESQDEKFDLASSKEAEDWKASSGQNSSQVTSSPRRGLCSFAWSKSVCSVRQLGSR